MLFGGVQMFGKLTKMFAKPFSGVETARVDDVATFAPKTLCFWQDGRLAMDHTSKGQAALPVRCTLVHSNGWRA